MRRTGRGRVRGPGGGAPVSADWPTIQLPPGPSDAVLEAERDADHARDVRAWFNRQLRLTHYSDVPVTLDRTRTYSQSAAGVWTYDKPDGLWVSVDGDDDWPSWCQSAGFHVAGLEHRHRVVLHHAANIRFLTSPADLDEFTREYAEKPQVGGLQFVGGRSYWGINWQEVAAEHDGIVIAPYQWSRRNTLPWYAGWDCASGCIWNLHAIAVLTPEIHTATTEMSK